MVIGYINPGSRQFGRSVPVHQALICVHPWFILLPIHRFTGPHPWLKSVSR
jgi:hypothetical protein